jgi:hypothetical protein
MTLFFVITFLFLLLVLVSILWTRGIDHMKENHPEYKGEDFLEWDDNKSHTEGDFH